MIEAGIISLLLASSSISSLVSTRITPDILPQGQVMPAITFQVIVGTAQPTLDTTGMQKWRVQFDCWGDTSLDATNVRDAVMLLMSNTQVKLANGITVTFTLVGPNGIPYSGGDELFRKSFDMYAFFTIPAAS